MNFKSARPTAYSRPPLRTRATMPFRKPPPVVQADDLDRLAVCLGSPDLFDALLNVQLV